MNKADKLLDEIVLHLRSSPTPEMPPELVNRPTGKTLGLVSYGMAAAALAASIAGLVIWHADNAKESRVANLNPPQPTNSRDSEVVVTAVDLSTPLTELERGLDAMDEEIGDLRGKAALVDSRRWVEELLARY